MNKYIYRNVRKQRGFTLTEMVVATTIFATSLVAMFSMFNYVLKINRRTEALRQASQGVRNFVEFLVKEVRNGKIDYTSPAISGQCVSSYGPESTSLSLLNADGERECIYYQKVNNVGQVFVVKQGVAAQNILPTNFDIDQSSFKFFVRPQVDPYVPPYPKIQPFVTMAMVFKVTLPTKETVTIPYQTTVSTEVYDVPR